MVKTRKRRITPDKVWTDEEVKVFKKLYDGYKEAYGKNPNVVALNIIEISVPRVIKGEECHWDETYPGKLVWGSK